MTRLRGNARLICARLECFININGAKVANAIINLSNVSGNGCILFVTSLHATAAPATNIVAKKKVP